MNTQLINVTPFMAREWLKTCNRMNRPIRPGHVAQLRSAFERGEYVATHQGIAFGDDDVLIDGQHRLSAIAQMPEDTYFPMLVTFGLNREAVFPVTDTTHAKRSTSDALRIDIGLGYVGNFFARAYQGNSSTLTPVFVKPFVDWAAPEYADLVNFCPASSKTWSSAPVRAAAIVAMKNRCDNDYVKLVYGALVRAEFNSMPPSVQALYRSHQSGKVRANSGNDIFARCIKAFDPKNANLQKLQINDVAASLAVVRGMMAAQIFSASKKAASAKRARIPE